MGFEPASDYRLCGMGGLWDMGLDSLQANLVDRKCMGLWESMGLEGYGL